MNGEVSAPVPDISVSGSGPLPDQSCDWLCGPVARGAGMALQLLVGSCVSALNIIIHALVTVVAIRVARATGLRSTRYPWLHLVGIMIATSLVLMAAHTLEVFVWSSAYAIANAAPEDANLVYFAFVNYTTLGYGDVTPLPGWRLLGPMAAMNGILMFGWSTAVLFEILRKTIDQLASASLEVRLPTSPTRSIGVDPKGRSGAGLVP
jgi:hypothetical protein